MVEGQTVPDSQQPSFLQRNAWLLDMAGQVALISAIPLAVSMALAEYMHHGDYWSIIAGISTGIFCVVLGLFLMGIGRSLYPK